jgi:protease-4
MKKILSFFGKVFGQTLFAMVSFFVILFLFSLLFIGIGAGVGAGYQSSFSSLKTAESSDYSHVSGDEDSDNNLLQVNVNGIILGSAPEEEFSFGLSEFLTYGYELADTLAEAAEDEDIKGVLMRFRTPGGTIFGSQAIYRAIRDYKEKTGNPVVVYIEGMSASGGVMAMVGADAIYADHGSLIGSIGVLGPSLTYFNQPMATDGGLFGGGIVTEGGIERTIITAGRGKDIGNPFRKPTEEEITTLTDGINTEYANFIEHVASNRDMKASLIRDEMGAQIFGNEKSETFGLIDGTLDRSAAIEALAKLAQLGDDYQLIKPNIKSESLFNQMMGVLAGRSSIRLSPEVFARQQVCNVSRQLTMAYHGNLASYCQ